MLALPSSPAMNPVVAKMPVPTMLEITSAVALKKPSCRSSPGLRPCVFRLAIRDLEPYYATGPGQNCSAERARDHCARRKIDAATAWNATCQSGGAGDRPGPPHQAGYIDSRRISERRA